MDSSHQRIVDVWSGRAPFDIQFKEFHCPKKAKHLNHGRLVLRGRLRGELERLVTPIKVHAGNEKFAAFLDRHLDEVFEFLRQPGLDATNYRAEQAIRPAVVNRKVWGGNRTVAGAHDQSIVMSVLRTCHQHARDGLHFLSQTLCAPSTAFAPKLAR